jgi:histidyl-tRNA synthetase
MQKIQAVRGMNDLLPQESKKNHFILQTLTNTLLSYGYDYIRTPIVEKTSCFKRAIGEVTDIVEKEMYSWQDGKENLSLRPEGTAGVVRAMIEHNLPRESVQKVFYFGPMFRHERPQKGRYREFFQFGVEVFADEGVGVDIEIIQISSKILTKFNIKANLEINTLGSKAERDNYKQVLTQYFSSQSDKLDEDSKRRLNTNPLRILDSKNPDMAAIIQNAPKLIDYLTDTSKQRFNAVQQMLNKLGINYTINPNLVRGLDYYNDIVFEWISDDLGAQGTICAGGRYDKLVEIMGGNPTPAVGFAIGIERLALLIDDIQKNDIFYLISTTNAENIRALELADTLRDKFTGIILCNDLSSKSFKNKFKKADKKNAKYALIIGENELANNTITFKFMQENKEQLTLSEEDLLQFLTTIIN